MISTNLLILATATKLISRFEGFRAKAYLCPASVWTIGFGSTFNDDGTPVTACTAPITCAQAQVRLEATLNTLLTFIHRTVHKPLTVNQTAALLSFIYNEGEGAFHTSTMLRLLNAGDIKGASAEFPKWDKTRVGGVMTTLPGLLKRRAAERKVFDTPRA